MLNTIDQTGFVQNAMWCGPGALSVLTGMPVQKATEMLAKMQGESVNKFKSTEDGIFRQALIRLGYQFRQVPLWDRYADAPTMQRYLKERPAIEKVTPLFMIVGSGDSRHICAAHYDYFCDNWTKRPVPVAEMPKPKRKLWDAWTVMKAV